ncbi:MotA/TolQ/ExbB proton channel family protein [Blautia schinkii]|nr:MotA/TolQ/ExbB proton channel family protein [Blautia schinkii]
MGKKITNVLLFIAVLAAAVGITVYVGQGAASVMIYNFVFLGVMVLIYLAGMIGGMFKMNNLSAAFIHAVEELTSIFKAPGKTEPKNLSYLDEIFGHSYLDKKMDNFTSSISKSQEGIGDIEEYINEEEIDLHIHKRLLEMVPDILTSLGILGTFVGLVWGLKNFEPNNYEAMTNSVAALVEGIKVAFLTSIYGISLSIVYTYGMKSEYSGMTEHLQAFLEKFHAYVMPTAENESRNLLVASQKLQTRAMKQMAEQFSVQMADSFEKVITPTFKKMNDSLDMLVASVTRCQQDAVKEILDSFMQQMHDSFKMQFTDFNSALEQLKKAQKDNADYTSALYQTMSTQLSDSYLKQEKSMKELLTELGSMQSRYMSTANRIVQENQEIQKMQQQDYQHLSDYLGEAEKSAAKFWVACNQTMQKYVESAAQGMEKATATNQLSGDLVKANKRIIEDFDLKMQEFVEYQKLAYKTMDQVRRLLSDITVAKENKDIYLMGGHLTSMAAQNANKETLEKVQDVLEAQGERQEALLEDMAKNIRELSKAAQKGKFSLFK